MPFEIGDASNESGVSTLRLDPRARSSEVSPGTPSKFASTPAHRAKTSTVDAAKAKHSQVGAKGPDDQEIVVEAKVKAMWVDDIHLSVPTIKAQEDLPAVGTQLGRCSVSWTKSQSG